MPIFIYKAKKGPQEMVEKTVRRISEIVPDENIFIITSELGRTLLSSGAAMLRIMPTARASSGSSICTTWKRRVSAGSFSK